MRRGLSPRVLLAVLGAAALARCASAPPPAPRDHFPIDPREGLSGPFDAAVARGWEALLRGDTGLAEREFRNVPDRGPSGRAAAIGSIEVLVAARRSGDALAPCTAALEGGPPTVPLLVACGEARARTADPVGAVELYDRAAAMAPGRPAFAARAEGLRADAAEALLEQALARAGEGRREEAQRQVARALGITPRSAAVLTRAGDVECELGEREQALGYYREAIALGADDTAVEERAGTLALELGDYGTAVSLFDGLAARDPSFADRAAEARLAFRIANWPDAERQAARARRLTRGGAALLVWWNFPEVREAVVAGAGVVASDVLERRDSRVMMRAVALGLLDVDPYTHRARPDAPLTRASAARMMLLLGARLDRSGALPECFQGAPGPGKAGQDAIRVAARCKLLSESGGSVVSGAEFTRGLDRLRSLFPAGEAMNRD